MNSMNCALRIMGSFRAPAFVLPLLVAGLSPADAQANDPAKTQFLTSCGTCHTADKGAGARVGPNLFGAYGRKAGTVAGFRYSSALANGGWKWDDAALDAFITNAQAAHPGTMMNYRQADPKKRALIIQYLKKMR
jgi:cytochrome c